MFIIIHAQLDQTVLLEILYWTEEGWIRYLSDLELDRKNWQLNSEEEIHLVSLLQNLLDLAESDRYPDLISALEENEHSLSKFDRLLVILGIEPGVQLAPLGSLEEEFYQRHFARCPIYQHRCTNELA